MKRVVAVAMLVTPAVIGAGFLIDAMGWKEFGKAMAFALGMAAWITVAVWMVVDE